VTVVVGQLSIAMYAGEPSNTSSCINVDIPDVVGVGQPLLFEGSASSGTINALTAEVGDAIGMFSLRDCDLQWLNQSYDLQGLSPGTYPMTVIGWTDDSSCSILVEHTLNVPKRGQLSVHCFIESWYCLRFWYWAITTEAIECFEPLTGQMMPAAAS